MYRLYPLSLIHTSLAQLMDNAISPVGTLLRQKFSFIVEIQGSEQSLLQYGFFGFDAKHVLLRVATFYFFSPFLSPAQRHWSQVQQPYLNQMSLIQRHLAGARVWFR
jgi:hypothetical protein